MRKFIVAKPNFLTKDDEGKTVKLAVGTEYTCDENHVISRVKSGHLVVAAEAPKVKAKKQERKEAKK